MKYKLLQSVKVQPYTSGNVIDRSGFFSAILGAVIGATGDLTVTITHSDDGTTFAPVTDERVFPEKKTTGGVYTTAECEAGDLVNIDIDLLGLKNFIRLTVSGAAASGTTLALAIGDSTTQPV